MVYRIGSLFLPLLFTVLSCGVKGNPKPPPIDQPSPITDIQIKQVGNFGLVIFRYPKLYIDSRPIKEDVEFRVFRNYQEIKVDVVKKDELHWFFDRLSEKQQCYEIMVRVKNRSSNPSKRVCIIPKTVTHPPLVELSLENRDEGILIKTNQSKKINLYRVNSPAEFNPIPFKVIEGEFLDSQVSVGRSLCYYYTFYLGDGVESDYSKSFCIIYMDTFPPEPPTMGKLIVNEDSSATIVWMESRSKDVVGYIIYKNSKPVLDQPVKTYFFTDRDYKEGDIYTVYSIDKANNKSQGLEIR